MRTTTYIRFLRHNVNGADFASYRAFLEASLVAVLASPELVFATPRTISAFVAMSFAGEVTRY